MNTYVCKILRGYKNQLDNVTINSNINPSNLAMVYTQYNGCGQVGHSEETKRKKFYESNFHYFMFKRIAARKLGSHKKNCKLIRIESALWNIIHGRRGTTKSIHM